MVNVAMKVTLAGRVALTGLILFLTSGLAKAESSDNPVIRSVEFIRPGTVVDKSAPRGWTHLILKSQPRLPEDQARLVGDMTAHLATMVFTCVAARVEPVGDKENRRYRLGGLGVGVGVKINGKDVIVTPDTQARLGANLGLLARQVLSAVCEKQRLVRLIAVGPTMAIMDTPAFMARGKTHSPVIIRYVFLVDSRSGRIDSICWRIDTDSRGSYDGTHGMMEWLAPDTLVDCVMKVDTGEFRLGIPSERAFAITSIPPGQRQFTIPDGLSTVSGKSRLTSEEAGRIGQSIRQMIQAQASQPAP